MVFTTQVFLFVFFPVCMIAYYGLGKLESYERIGKFFRNIRSQDLALIALSLGFYMCAHIADVFRLIAYIGFIYLLARWIEAYKNKRIQIPTKTNVFGISIVLVVFILVYYNYSGMLAQIWNWIFKDHIEEKSLVAPLGLSFLTFSAVSYLTDIYRGNATSGSLIDCALYLSFFPKVISGPIVLWKDFQGQITKRTGNLDFCVSGINRIMIGFAKKIILADTIGAQLFQIGNTGIDRITAVGSFVLYMLQIYYDFSGYSDIAIGLCRLLGFDVKENFDFPYRSKSISEFWRRWHISLGSWFREYVYFPLGGSRSGYRRTLRNLAIVFTLTGIWHGTGWNYILWGLINGTLVVLERILKDKPRFQKIPGFIKYAFTMLIVMIFWQFFRFQNLSEILNMWGIILGVVRFDRINYTWRYYFDAQTVVFAVIGILGATLLGSQKLRTSYQKLTATSVGYLLQEVVLAVLFVISIIFMVSSGYSPFIYFQY